MASAMSDVTFDRLGLLNLLWVAALVALVGVYGVYRRRRGLRVLADQRLLPVLTTPPTPARLLTRLGLVVTCLVALTAALLGPRWGAAAQTLLRRDIDVFVLLDVSRSMLARDLAPNRLQRAKLAIRDDLLPSLGGDRIGLIAFAGAPSLVCPLTADYGYFRLALADVTPRSAALGGTVIGDAIRKAGDLFAGEKLNTHKLVLLITDGEDHESFPVQAAARIWNEQRIPVIALALGDPEQGARIPVAGDRGEQYLDYQGTPVRSRADFAMLEQVAAASPGGVFVAVGTRNFDLRKIYDAVVSRIRAAEVREERTVQQPSRFQGFALLALLVLLVDSLLRDAPGPPGGRAAVARAARPGVGALLILLAWAPPAGATAPVAAPAAQNGAFAAAAPRALIAQGHRQFAAGQYAAALDAYEQAAARDPRLRTPELVHDQAAAQFKLGALDAARDLWTQVKEAGDAAWEARMRYNLANCDYAAALPLAEQNPAQALELLAQAAAQYQAALRLDPRLVDARANFELAHKLRRAIAEQNPQSQPADREDTKKSADGDQPKDQQDKQKQPEQDQRKDDAQQQQQQDQPQDGNRDPHQQDASEAAPQSDPNQAPQPDPAQPPPQGEPRDANGTAGEQPQPQPQQGDPNQAAPPESGPNAPPPQMSRAQAEMLLQKIRDLEKKRRELQAQQRMARQRPVEKDW